MEFVEFEKLNTFRYKFNKRRNAFNDMNALPQTLSVLFRSETSDSI